MQAPSAPGECRLAPVSFGYVAMAPSARRNRRVLRFFVRILFLDGLSWTGDLLGAATACHGWVPRGGREPPRSKDAVSWGMVTAVARGRSRLKTYICFPGAGPVFVVYYG